jgi:flavin-dependent dehydrogenase
MQWDYDVIVVGAGVAGSAAAIALGREGARVLLLDRATFPRHKTCGEGIMPEGVAILDSMGVLPAMLAQGAARAEGLRFQSPAGVWAAVSFAAGKSPGLRADYSLVMRRYELDHILLQQAKQTPGVTVREGLTVTDALIEGGAITGVTGHDTRHPEQGSSFTAPLTLGADGMHSRFHNRYGIVRRTMRRERWGIAGHLSGVQDPSSYIEVMFQAGSEIYTAPMGDDCTLVAILIEKRGMRALRGPLPQKYLEFLQAAPGLGERIRHSRVVPPVGARGPLGYTVQPVFRPGLLLIGDSAGFLDPITGEGMTLALKCVQAALPVVRRALDTGDVGDEALAPYALERARIIGDVSSLTRLMLTVSRSRLLTNQAIHRLSRDRALFEKLAGIVTGTSRYRDFTLRDRLALAIG